MYDCSVVLYGGVLKTITAIQCVFAWYRDVDRFDIESSGRYFCFGSELSHKLCNVM